MAAFHFNDELEAGTVVELEVGPGYDWLVTGWASVDEAMCWAYICCRSEKDVNSYAIANNFNSDAFARNIGFGWVGFSLDLSRKWNDLKGRTLSFYCAKSGCRLFEYDAPDITLPPQIAERASMNILDFIRASQTENRPFAPDQLSLYLSEFLKRHDKSEFVRRAYTYILERDVDEGGLNTFVRALTAGLNPADLLRTLVNSDEYQSRERKPLALPGEALFPFYPGRT